MKADGPSRTAFRSRICCKRANLRLVTGNGKSEATFGEAEAEILDAFVWLPLCRSHLATGDRSAARQPRRDRDRRRPDHQSAGRPQPNRRRGGDGHRHGAVRSRPSTTRRTVRRSTATWPITSMAVNADVPPIDVHFLDYPDKEINDSARAASAKSAWPASPPRSPRRFITPPAFACANCRSRSRTC